jgi:hypothetical protein
LARANACLASVLQMDNLNCMDSTLTIRLDKQHRDALRKRARAARKTESELARELLTAGLGEKPDWEAIKQYKGSVRLPNEKSDPWREHLRRMNWRK